MTTPQERTAKANQVRRMKFLERKADEYAAALRELGYTVIAPGVHRAKVRVSDPTRCVECGEDPNGANHLGSPACPLCGGVNGHASICDDYGRES
jgi:hypothetical protein